MISRSKLAALLCLFVFAGFLNTLAGCAGSLAQRQAQSDLTLGVYADSYANAIESKRLTDQNIIRAGRELLREWNRADVALHEARISGDFQTATFWKSRLYGDGTPDNPGIIARAAKLALNWRS